MDGEQTTLAQDGPIRSSHKSGHMTARTQRIELITRGERRRRWSIEEKREIVAESLRPGVRPSEIIQRRGITSGQLYAWRQQRHAVLAASLPRPGDRAQPAPSFARVDVVSRQPQENTTPAAETTLTRPSVQVPLSAVSRMKGLIEIVLPGGTSVRVDAQVDDRALRCVLGALRER
jgi:transposase